jgi:hypothetical protein
VNRRLLLAAPAMLFASPARAVEWRGTPAQGALLIGRAAPGTRLALDGRTVRVSPEGHFAFGFGRDHAAQATLSVNGQPRPLEVAKRDWQVQRLDGLPGAMVTPPPETMERIGRERARIAECRRVDSAVPHFAAGFVWPAQGRISGVYGSQRILNGQPRAPHLGLDIAAPVGTPMHAMCAGRVLLADDLYFTGNTVILDHGHGVQSLYAHASRLEVAEGAQVAAGERIALIGATGRVTGPHLHLGLNWYGTAVDPEPMLPPR